MNSPLRTICYVCGEALTPENRSKDHVPPKGIFPRPFPANLITVSCCRNCNESYSKDEEFFRLIATLGINRTPEAEALYEQRTLPNTIKKSKLKNEIAHMMATSDIQWAEVNGVMTPVSIMRVPTAPLKTVAGKVARGLIAHLHPALATHRLHLDTYMPSSGKLLEVFAFLAEDLTELRIGGSAFHAYHGVCADAPSVGVWLMTFHQRIPIAVFHYDDEHAKLIRR
jgi:hypothetical protein